MFFQPTVTETQRVPVAHHFMKVKGGCPWSFPLHDKCPAFFSGESRSVLHGQLSLLQAFQPGTAHPSRSLPKSLSPCRGRRIIRNRKLGRNDGKVSIFRANLSTAQTSWNNCSGFCFSHQTQKEIPNLVYDFFLISVYKVNMGAWFNAEWRRTSVLLLENLDFDTCMNFYSEKFSTRVASGLMICCEGWQRFQLWGFELILDFSFWDNVLAVLPALSSHYWYPHLPPAPSLTPWEGHTPGIYSSSWSMVTVTAKMNGEESFCMFLCLKTFSRLEISGDFYCYLFWQQPLNMK